MYLPNLRSKQSVLWRIGQLDKHRSAEREAASSHPGQTNTQGLKITEEKVLPLERHLQTVSLSSLLG